MDTNRIIPGQTNLPAQVTSTKGKSGEEAFHDLAKSEGYDKGALEQVVSERTRLTRTRKSDGTRKKHSSLFLVDDNGGLEEEPVYRTVMVDGVLFTLRLLAVA